MKKALTCIVFLSILLSILLIASCGGDKKVDVVQPKVTKPAVTDDVKVVKSQTVEPEEEEKHIEVVCGDGRCDNFQSRSTTNRYACSYGAVKSNKLDCNIEIVEGQMISTENYFTCPEDCNNECGVDLYVDVFEKDS